MTVQSKIDSFLQSFVENPVSNHDPIRGKTYQVEYISAQLAASISILKKAPTELVKQLLTTNRRGALWEEKGYHEDDEEYGHYGAVPSAYALIALCLAYKNLDEDKIKQEIFEHILNASDEFYGQENNGSFKKSAVNKSDVLNTNLLVAMALWKVSQILNENSNRRIMYQSAARRVLRKVMMAQLPGGELPYHHSTYAVPVLYQAMVVAQLNWFQKDLGNPLLNQVYQSGKTYLETFFDSNGIIDWSKANNHDKKGAIWAYGFTVACESRHSEKAMDHLLKLQREGLVPTEANDKMPLDPFYTSWVVWALIFEKEERKKETNDSASKLKMILLRSMAIAYQLKFIYEYTINRFYNFLFEAGAHENRNWKSK